MTPGILAILSIIIGIFPLLVAMLASGVAKLYGCQLNEGGISDCARLSKRAPKVLYSMFVFARMTMFTGGLGVFGVISSIIWAVFW